MRSVPTAFQNVLEAPQVFDVVTLVKINATTPIYRALWESNVTFDGDTYMADEGAHSQISADLGGERPGMSLTLQNADGNWSTYLASNDLNGVEVEFKIVAEQTAGDSTAVLNETDWYVSGWRMDGQALTLKLGSPHDALAFTVPSRPLVSPTCFWKYKVGSCTSKSSQPTCDKTVAACRARFPTSEPLRIGPSFPFVSRARRRR